MEALIVQLLTVFTGVTWVPFIVVAFSAFCAVETAFDTEPENPLIALSTRKEILHISQTSQKFNL